MRKKTSKFQKKKLLAEFTGATQTSSPVRKINVSTDSLTTGKKKIPSFVNAWCDLVKK